MNVARNTHAALYISYIQPVQLALENTLEEYWSRLDAEISALKKVFELAVLEVLRAAGRHRGLVPLLRIRQFISLRKRS